MQLMLFLTTWLLAGGLSVNVTPLDGAPYQAQLMGANEGQLNLLVDGANRQVALSDLQSVERSEASDKVSPAIRVTLRDGSQLPVDEVLLADDQATLKLRRQGTLTVPIRQLSVIRFRAPAAQVDAQWTKMVSAFKADDQLVIRRGTDTLDAAGGVIKGITAEHVLFELGGSPIEAPLGRLEGVVFGGGEAGGSASGKLRVKDIYGAVWNASELSEGPTEGVLTLTTTAGLQHELRIDLLQSIELSNSIVFLTSVEPLEQTFKPFIAVPEAVSSEQTRTWLGARTDENRSLIVPSQSTLTYRIEPGFERFLASVQIDPSVTLGGRCDVRVLLNGEASWEKTLQIGEPSQTIELPIGDASRLTLEVDYGGDGDIGDIVHIREPRLVK